MTDPTAEWPLMPDPRISDDAYYRRLSAAYSHRLRTTAEALRGEVDDIDWIFACFPALSEVLTADQIARLCQRLTDARAVLAALEKEGLA